MERKSIGFRLFFIFLIINLIFVLIYYDNTTKLITSFVLQTPISASLTNVTNPEEKEKKLEADADSVIPTFPPSKDWTKFGSSKPPERKRKLIILSAMFRSGSSFLGSLFDKNPNFNYYFEPLTMFKFPNLKKTHENPHFLSHTTPYKLEMLKDILECKIPFVTKYVNHIYRVKGFYGQFNDVIHYPLLKTTCYETGVCQWFMNSQMCEGPLCPHSVYDHEKSIPPQCKEQCTPPNRYNETQKQILIDHCENSEASVIKVIRIEELNDLLPLYQNSNFDLKVVLLVRNPIAVYDSRLRLWEKYLKLNWGNHDDKHYNFIKFDCQRTVRSKMSFDKNELIKNNTLIIRYEDIALHELEMAKKIYHFVGHDIHQNVLDYIIQNKRKRRSKNKHANPHLNINSLFPGKKFVPEKLSKKEYNRMKAEYNAMKVNKTENLKKWNLFGVNKKKDENSISKTELVSEVQKRNINNLCRKYIDLFEYSDHK
jgi:hypothetical protein